MPTDASSMGQRIRYAVDKLGNRKIAASVLGVSSDQLARYMRGENEPKVGPIYRLAQATEVSLEWIISGSGSPKSDDARTDADKEVFLLVARLFAERTHEISMQPERFADTLFNLSSHARAKATETGHVDVDSLSQVIDFALASSK